MIQLRFCFVLAIGLLLLGGTRSVWAQTSDMTTEDIRAQTDRIQQEIGAARAASDQREALQQQLADVREIKVVVDSCLAKAKYGFVYFSVAFGVSCTAYNEEEYLRLLRQRVRMDHLAGKQVHKLIVDSVLASRHSVQILRGMQVQLQAEMDRIAYQIASVRTPNRTDFSRPVPQQPAAPQALAGSCLLGSWQNSAKSGGYSTWTIDADGKASESGLGNATGTATVSGHTLTIRWTTSNGYTGYYQIMFDPSCQRGEGSAVQETAPPGITPTSSQTTWTR